MTTISSKKNLYSDLCDAICGCESFNAARYAYESGIEYSRLRSLISLGEQTGLLLCNGGYDFSVDTSKIMPKTIGDLSSEAFAEMLDDISKKILEYIFSCDTDPTRDKVLDQSPSFRKSRYESSYNLLKSRRVLTELGGRVRANLTKETYELIRKVYEI